MEMKASICLLKPSSINQPTERVGLASRVVRSTPVKYLSKTANKCLTFYVSTTTSTFPEVYLSKIF